MVPIDYAFRPRLRSRLTLRGLTLRRNPWTYGDRVSHSVYRYSCQHSRFRYLQQGSHPTFAGLRNAPLPRRRTEDRVRRTESELAFRRAMQSLAPARDDTRLAMATSAARRCSPDPGSLAATPASRHSNEATRGGPRPSCVICLLSSDIRSFGAWL